MNYQVTQKNFGKFEMAEGVIQKLFNPVDDTGLTQFLEENGLHYGYSNYLDGLRVAAFSNGRIRIAVYPEDNPLKEDDWMLSKTWYEYENYADDCFILVKKDNSLDEKYYKLADEVLHYTANYKESESFFWRGEVDYEILVFNQNIHLYKELAGNEQ